MQSLLRRLEAGGALSCAGVSAAAQPFLAVLLRHVFPKRPIVIVADGLKTQESFQQDIETWLAVAEFKVEGLKFKVEDAPAASSATPRSALRTLQFFYPAWEILPHESKLPHPDIISERLETLVALSKQSEIRNPKSAIVTASVAALLQRTFHEKDIASRTRTLKRGDRIEPLDLVEWLEDQGYEPEAQVTQKGELALRGGILDIYPLTSSWPVRLEFFGDELESLRQFDPITQISRDQITSVTLPPGGELGILKRMRSGERGVRSGETAELATLLDYLPPETIFLVCEPESVAANAEQYEQQVPADDPFFISWEDFREQALAKQMSLLEVADSPDASDITSHASYSSHDGCTLNFPSLDAFRPLGSQAPDPQIAEAQRREFFAQLHRWSRQGYAVHVFCNNTGERQRFEEIWKDYGFHQEIKVTAPEPGRDSALRRPSGHRSALSLPREDSSVQKGDPSGAIHPSGSLIMHLGALGRGFIHDESKLVVATDAEIFGRYKVQRPRRLKSPHAAAARSALDIDFTDFEEGDYVVHLQHGIGRFLGLKVLPVTLGRKHSTHLDAPPPEESGQECLVIEYAPNDPQQSPPKLYVPVTEAHLVSKYVGAGKARPPLNALGGTRWAKAKAHAERAVRDVASELLAIQAARESQPGHAFQPDTPWQREFESAFLYEETRDQMRAINETKSDMERPKPMDRLICGDVGFGKTEVAIRAAFKAVMDGRQVAVLVPTTVLAQQHYNTFRERMADYPVRVELLSRFRSPRERARVVRDLPAGSVDIVIGTHRLLQKDIAFKDLGLVVIDEEQRFGVLHKEKFKQLRRLVDVLTLSATPIPRTLYLALTGARDMSTIETPPQDRLPVETIVAQYDERLIRDAIQRELNRGGQVFFLHNRVSTIEGMAHKLRALLPHARIVVGHGQMHADDLEEVMTKFVNGEADVLLSTTIIESGLDIPNANTIMIDRADRFGLSDLYQLRGRVGRYKHQAYAYLLLPRHAGLLADARKRITALKQYSTLGSGFKIAMRDLEIRGAGNMLGPEQSGQITAVGFELYCQLLKQSVAALKGEKVKPRVEVQVRFDFLALNPGEEGTEIKKEKGKIKNEEEPLGISIPREVASYMSAADSQDATRNAQQSVPKVSAFIPLSYISEAQQRIEIYRKLAQANEKAALDSLQTELRDRFGPLPPAMEMLLQVGELKILASERGITVMEVKEDRLMLTRNNDYIMLGGKFPRLTKPDAKGRLKEIKKLLLAL
ncbi:MAG TPA: transcription-repair coupling factor [Verrucomicrobiae bacterium]|nr:transcription-repair coupling factor [Verrucomicrobiae bacterium]